MYHGDKSLTLRHSTWWQPIADLDTFPGFEAEPLLASVPRVLDVLFFRFFLSMNLACNLRYSGRMASAVAHTWATDVSAHDQ